MKLTEEVTAEDFYSNTSNTRKVEVNDNTKASFTHYLYSSKDDCSHGYQQGAVNYVRNILTNKSSQKNISFEVAESALQRYLPSLRREVPFSVPKHSKFKFIEVLRHFKWI